MRAAAHGVATGRAAIDIASSTSPLRHCIAKIVIEETVIDETAIEETAIKETVSTDKTVSTNKTVIPNAVRDLGERQDDGAAREEDPSLRSG